MSRAIRFSAPQKEAVRWVIHRELGLPEGWGENKKYFTALAKLLEKMEAAEQPVEQVAKGLGWRQFKVICENVLGDRLVVPTLITNQYAIVVSKTIRDFGVTEDTALQAALAAKRLWRGKVKLESIARQVNVLLSDYKEESSDDGTPAGNKWTLAED